MGEVRKLHNAVDNGEAHSDQRIDSSQRDAADEKLYNGIKIHVFPP